MVEWVKYVITIDSPDSPHASTYEEDVQFKTEGF